MTYTTNYSLHKPDTTDNFNVGDFNANSDIIDKQFGITSANIPKVTCSTSASTVAKTATINGTFVLNRGARVLVVLSTANTVASATFNLNSTGAKPILVNGASVTTSNLTTQTYLAEYDGTNWRFTTSTYTSDYARTSNSASSATTATSASKLTTARKTYVTLGTASTTTTRDWSGDTTIPVSGTLAVANGGTGTTSLSNITVGNSSKLGNYSVQTSSIGGSSTESTNYWTYVTKSKFTSTGGYIKYSNGLLIEWGLVPAPSSGKNSSVTFILTYTEIPAIIVNTRGYSDSDDGNSRIGHIIGTKTGFKCDSNVGTETKVRLYWMSIGY